MVIERRRLADEQGVELGQAAVVGARDQIDIAAELRAGPYESFDRLRVRRRQLLLRIVQDGDRPARRRRRPLCPPGRLRVSIEGLDEDLPLLRPHLPNGDRLDGVDGPAPLVFELDGEQRTAEQLEDAPGGDRQAWVVSESEEDRRRKRWLLLGRNL